MTDVEIIIVFRDSFSVLVPGNSVLLGGFVSVSVAPIEGKGVFVGVKDGAKDGASDILGAGVFTTILFTLSTAVTLKLNVSMLTRTVSRFELVQF
mmetsp:Transcript_72104/g.146237  ORF Transcript_72104/g.146237 Transcript_72104/m.146237 type:complete len:95 (-) Transcript_72104:769-1053(-)